MDARTRNSAQLTMWFSANSMEWSLMSNDLISLCLIPINRGVVTFLQNLNMSEEKLNML